jgi:WD40 repeat protein
LTELAMDLGVRGRGDPGEPVPLESLIARGKRIALFDLDGAGKRTAARKVFHARIVEARDPEFLPCWLPDFDADMSPDGDLLESIALTTRDRSGPEITGKQVGSWLAHGDPLLLFLELDEFASRGDQEKVLAKLHALRGDLPDMCCVVMSDSDLGLEPTDLQRLGYTLYEIERPGQSRRVKRSRFKQGLFRLLRRPGVEDAAHGDMPDLPRPFGGEALPCLLHLFYVYPTIKAGTEAQAVANVVGRLLSQKFENVTRIRAAYGSDDRYRKSIQDALGLIALGTLLPTGDDPGPAESPGFTPPSSSSHDYNFINKMLDELRGRDPVGELLDLGDVGREGRQRLLELGKAVANCELSLLVRRGAGVGFIGDNFRSYLAARYLRDYALSLNQFPGDRSWCEYLLRCFEGRPQLLRGRVAEFVGGLLFPVQIRELLTTAIIREPDREVPRDALPRTIFDLCRGADPASQVSAALCHRGRAVRGWYSLDDPLLLRGELHGLLKDAALAGDRGAEVLRQFVARLDALLGAGRPWVERTWPIPMEVGLATEHEARVTALRVLSDGRIASGDAAGVVVVWDRYREDGGRIARKLHDGPVRALEEIDYDGRLWIVSAGDDRTVRLWYPDPRDSERKTQPRAHAGKVLALTVVRVGREHHVVSAGLDGFLYDWSPSAFREPEATTQRHWGSVRFLRVVPKANPPLVVSAGDDGSVWIWKVGRDGLEFRGALSRREKPEPVTALACGRTHVLWGDQLGRVSFVHLPKDKSGRVVLEGSLGDPVLSCRKHARAVTSLLVTENHFFSAGLDGHVFKWSWNREGLQARALETAAGPMRGGDRTPDRVLYTSIDESQWTLGPSRSAHDPGTGPGPMTFLRVLPGGSQELVTTEDRLVRIRKLEGATDRERQHRGRVTALAMGTGFIVSGGGDGSVMLFDRDRDTGRFSLRRRWPDHHHGPVMFLRVCEPLDVAGRGGDARGPIIVTAGKDGMVCVWRGAPASPVLQSVWRGAAPVTALWADERAVVWAGKDGRIFMGDPATERLSLLQMDAGGGEVKALDARRVAPEASALDLIAATLNEEVICARAAADFAPVKMPTSGGHDAIRGLRWLDGEWVALAREDHVVVVDARGGGPARRFEAPKLSVLGRSPAGRWIAFGTSSGDVDLIDWRAEPRPAPPDTDELDGPPRPHRHGHRVVDLQFIGEDAFVWASRDGKVKLACLEEGGMTIVAGYPVGGQITAMAVTGPSVLAGLADGHLVALRVHTPAKASGG